MKRFAINAFPRLLILASVILSPQLEAARAFSFATESRLMPGELKTRDKSRMDVTCEEA